MNTQFTKIIDGKVVIKERKHIILNRIEYLEDPDTGEKKDCVAQTFNPSDEMLFADGGELYTPPVFSDEFLLEDAKENKKLNIKSYDSSSDVNIFYIQDIPVGLDKATRAGLKLRFEAEIAIGKTETTLWYDNIQFPLELNVAVQMLYAIEIYASKCYDNTQFHLANVNELDNLEDVLSYDYTVGYPEKLKF